MENRGSADDVDDVAKDSSRAGGIQEHDFADESDLPSMAMSSSAPSGSSPYASLSSPSAAKVDDRDVAHGAGRVGDTKKLEHALLIDPRMQLPAGFGLVDSMGWSPVAYASNDGVGPGAFPVRSARNTVTSRTVRSPIGSYDSPKEFATEESQQEDGVPNSAAAGIGVYPVEAQRVPDGNEDGTVLVAEAQYVSRMKWYQRRWIVGGLALCACGFAAAVAVMVVLLVRQPSASNSSSLTSPPTVQITGAPSTPEVAKVPPTPVPSEDAPSTPEPTTAPPTTAPITTAPATPDPTPPPPTFAPIAPISPTPKPISTAFPTQAPTSRRPTTTSNPISTLTPFGIACNFLSIPDVTTCRSTFVFDSDNGVTTTGSTIPSEIGLLTQLTYLDVEGNSLSSTIPSEIGLLTQLTKLDISRNALTSTIPSEIGLLTLLTELDFSNNQLTGTIPSSLCSRTSLYGNIAFDDGEITCATPFGIACDFLSIRNVTECRSTFVFDSDNGVNTTGSTIPSEIGLLTQLTYLDVEGNSLSSTIPSEIGLLTQLTKLDISNNALASTIPSEIGLLTLLTELDFRNNELTGTIPSSLCSLTSLYGNIGIDDGEITCASGCCF
ncbi:hypothetical protein MHU86_9415 [Fragilaria crotonensis]|nr:hypothetical protein MHU86_9415 [Fragilaria crotonensis]